MIDRLSSIALALATFLACTGASAATISINCEREDVMVAAWNGPLVVTYEGEAAGTLTAKSATFEISMPATMEQRSSEVDGKQQTATIVIAFEKTTSRMPDLAALEACIAKTIDPAQTQDKDSFLTARDSCLWTTPIGTAAIEITASIKVGIFPGEPPEEFAPIVEIQRIYNEKTSAPGGTITIETFPAKCTMAGK